MGGVQCFMTVVTRQNWPMLATFPFLGRLLGFRIALLLEKHSKFQKNYQAKNGKNDVINGARGAPLTYDELGVVVVVVCDAVSQRICVRFQKFFLQKMRHGLKSSARILRSRKKLKWIMIFLFFNFCQKICI
jgi:hypothetical protein